MKHIVAIVLFLSAGVLTGGAVGLDVEGFGTALHGWKKDRTAVYKINNNTYRTHRPTGTRTKDSGLFLSTRIDEGGRFSKGAVCFLELTFTADGHLVGAQIRANMQGKRLDTGLISRRPEAPVLPEGGGGEADWTTPTSRLVTELFTRFDSELGKLDAKEGDKPVRRDIFGRVTGGSARNRDVPAAVRHNLNLLLANIGPGGSFK